VDWYASVAKHVVYPLWAVKDGERYLSILRDLETSQHFSPDKLARLRLGRLRTIIEYAYENCPFYKERFDKSGFVPSSLESFADIQVIPCLTKEDIQTRRDDIVARRFRGSPRLMADRTGGSTGKPLHYYRDRRRFDYLKASAIRHDRWAGHDIGDKQAVIWGNRHDFSGKDELKSRIRNLMLDRKLVLDSSSITEDKMAEFVEAIRRFRPKTVLAYANSCALFAKYLLDKGIEDIRVDSVITSAELLDPDDRIAIEQAFHCRVFDRYACREIGMIASECEAHDGLHINAECVYVEFVRDGRPAAPGEEGDVIITDLVNFGMPFIRYRIEDVGVPTDRLCSCGRGLPLMEMVAGRTTDFLLCPDGRKVSGAALTIYLIANTPGVRQAQIVQETRGSVRLRLVRSEEFTEDSMAFLEKQVPEFFGEAMRVEYEFVDAIPSEPSGKYRFSICKLDRD